MADLNLYQTTVFTLKQFRDAALTNNLAQANGAVADLAASLSAAPALHVFVSSNIASLVPTCRNACLFPALSTAVVVASRSASDALTLVASCSAPFLLFSLRGSKPVIAPCENWIHFLRAALAGLVTFPPSALPRAEARRIAAMLRVSVQDNVAPHIEGHLLRLEMHGEALQQLGCHPRRDYGRDSLPAAKVPVPKRPRTLPDIDCGHSCSFSFVAQEPYRRGRSFNIASSIDVNIIQPWLEALLRELDNLAIRCLEEPVVKMLLLALTHSYFGMEGNWQFCATRAALLNQAAADNIIDVKFKQLPPSLALFTSGQSSGLNQHTRFDVLAIAADTRLYLASSSSLAPPNIVHLSESLTCAFLHIGRSLLGCLETHIGYLRPAVIREAMRSFIRRQRLTATHVSLAISLGGVCSRAHPASSFLWSNLTDEYVVERLFLSDDPRAAASLSHKPVLPRQTALGALAWHVLSFHSTQVAIGGDPSESTSCVSLQRLELRITWLLSRWAPNALSRRVGSQWARLGAALSAAGTSMIPSRELQRHGQATPQLVVCVCGLVATHDSKGMACLRRDCQFTQAYVVYMADEQFPVYWETHAHVLGSTLAPWCGTHPQLIRPSRLTELYKPVSDVSAFKGLLRGLSSAYAHLQDAFPHENVHGKMVPRIHKVANIPAWLPLRQQDDGLWVLKDITDFLKTTHAFDTTTKQSSSKDPTNCQNDLSLEYTKAGIMEALECISVVPDIWCRMCHGRSRDIPTREAKRKIASSILFDAERILQILHVSVPKFGVYPSPIAKLMHIVLRAAGVAKPSNVVTDSNSLEFLNVRLISGRMCEEHVCRPIARTSHNMSQTQTDMQSQAGCIHRAIEVLRKSGN